MDHRGFTARGRVQLVGLAAATCAILAGCHSASRLPQPVGDPDPGHRRMTALAPVLSVVPPGVRPSLRKKYAPNWDSCDSRPESFGWDPVTVDVDWPYTGRPAEVVEHVKSAMASLGWTPDPASATGDWTWHLRLSTGDRASAELLGGPGSQPPDWALEATAPPAVHPVKGC